MKGLIVHKEWLDLIMEGDKTLEIRGTDTNIIDETIYLLEAGSRRIRGTCKIHSTYPISCSDWHNEMLKHHVYISFKELKEIYPKPYAWVLTQITEIKEEKYYRHPRGAVRWIREVIEDEKK